MNDVVVVIVPGNMNYSGIIYSNLTLINYSPFNGWTDGWKEIDRWMERDG